MAISKMLNIKEDRRKGGATSNIHLYKSLEYILNPEKTAGGLYTGAFGCVPDAKLAFRKMMLTKELYGKTDKRQAYHFAISLKSGEGNEETMLKITEEFIERYFKSEYEIVYSVHNSTDKIHSHIIFNSVNFVDGKKYRYENGDWEKEIQPIINELCEKYTLSTIDLKEQKEENEKINWNEKIKKDIDDAILISNDFYDFIEVMRNNNYKISYGKYLTVRPEGKIKNVRTKSLGYMYSEYAIKQRILMVHKSLNNTNTQRIVNYKKAKIKYIKMKKVKYKELSSVKKMMFVKYIKIKKIINANYDKRQGWKTRSDYKNLKESQRMLEYIFSNNINSISELNEKYDTAKEKNYNVYSEIKKLEKEKKIYEKITDAYNIVNEMNSKFNFSDNENNCLNNPIEYAQYILNINLIKNTNHSMDEIENYLIDYENRKFNLNEQRKEYYREFKLIEKIIKEFEFDKHMQAFEKKMELDDVDNIDYSFDDLSKYYMEKSITLEHALNRHVEIDYSSEDAYYVIDRQNPNTYIRVKTDRDIFEGEAYTCSEYYLYNDNELIKNDNQDFWTDKKEKGQDRYFWFNLKKEMLGNININCNDVIILKEKAFNKYRESFNKRNSNIMDRIFSRENEAKKSKV